MRKISKSLDSHIPLLQVAYRKHLLITSEAFGTKLVMCEASDCGEHPAFLDYLVLKEVNISRIGLIKK